MSVRTAALAAALVLGCAPRAAVVPPVVTAPAPSPTAADEAYAARKAGDFARAAAVATAEIEAGRGTARLHFERAVARTELGAPEDALADLRAVNALQEDAQALLLAGALELRLARWEDAERDFARSVALSPKNARGWASLAQARVALNDLDGAEAAHRSAVGLAPEDPYVREVGERLVRAAAERASPAR